MVKGYTAKITRADADTHIETPEGIELVMPLADPVARGYAFAIDFALRLGIVWIAAASMSVMGGAGIGMFLVLLFFVWWGYYVLFEMWWDGSSPGKRAMKLRVVNDDFTPINFSASLIRNLLRTADLMPGCYGLAAATMLCNRNNKRLGDIAAKTVVVSLQRPRYRQISVGETALPPDVVLTQEEQRRIVDFARFYEVNSSDRANEIAFHLSEAMNERNVNQLTTRLRRYAKWFLGENT